MKKSITALVAMYVALYPAFAGAYVGLCCGKCGGNMPMNIPGAGVPETHEFRFKISPMIMSMNGLRDGTDSVSSDSLLGSQNMGMSGMDSSSGGDFMAVPESMDMNMLNMAMGYSFTDDFFGGLMFMWKDNTMPMKFNSMMESKTGKSGFNMESSGMADTMLMAKYRLYADDPLIPTRQVSLFMGLSLPTGSIDEKNETHPMSARRSEQAPYSMQLGSGTFDPMLGLVYQGSASPWWWGVNLIYMFRPMENARGYSLGDELSLDFYSMYQVRYDIVVQFQLNGKVKNPINGEMDEAVSGESGMITQGDAASGYVSPLWDPENYGGTSLFATVGAQWQPFPLHIIDLSFGLPVYQNLNGPQLEEGYRMMLTWYMEVPTPSSVRYTGKDKQGKSRLGF